MVCLLGTTYSGTTICMNSRKPVPCTILNGLKSFTTNFTNPFVNSLLRLLLNDNFELLSLKYETIVFEELGFTFTLVHTCKCEFKLVVLPL